MELPKESNEVPAAEQVQLAGAVVVDRDHVFEGVAPLDAVLSLLSPCCLPTAVKFEEPTAVFRSYREKRE